MTSSIDDLAAQRESRPAREKPHWGAGIGFGAVAVVISALLHTFTPSYFSRGYAYGGGFADGLATVLAGGWGLLFAALFVGAIVVAARYSDAALVAAGTVLAIQILATVVGAVLGAIYGPNLGAAQDDLFAWTLLRLQITISSSYLVTSLAGAFVGGWLVARRDVAKAQRNPATP